MKHFINSIGINWLVNIGIRNAAAMWHGYKKQTIIKTHYL